MGKKFAFGINLFTLLIIGCGSFQAPKGSTDGVSHELWNQQLKKFVDERGWVNYQSWKNDYQRLKQYLELLSENPPDENSWSQEQQLAYWINAYNAFTVDLILRNYPLESITDLHPTLYVPGVNTVWHKKFFEIGEQPMSLDEIEHKILRKKFDEPRIHFAIVCASYSCPKLRNEAFVANRLETQLNEQAVSFINDAQRNVIGPHQVEISKIFQWFSGDFTKEGSIIDFLNQYSEVKIDSEADIDYMKYDWSLNGK